MSRDYWFISDTHFSHQSILKWGRGEFSSVEEMNEHMVDRWNSVVKQGDKVYHLGDVFFGPKKDFESLWPRLNGSKRLILGNHDDVKYMSKGGFFQKVDLWCVWHDKPLLFSHVPIHQDCIQERILDSGGINVHGHTHLEGSPDGPYRSVCVELNNYTPVNLEELV
jgi:calcineurin-like phosphoesterase family protein